ncbi:hypothetical protein CBW24_09540 [Pacificitalea manganoxidans]|uniref:Uncharacterized protein n=1 Tax=Pacificitalea manganoxidans TaxID=1411902 RepID=A0A291LZZ3_9RHOB|nr:DUF3772 domain-containing protein [Pacificitalea manganoxidans]ATI42230.1 hypothetical protein CBW24_09540 [Pacificitalea manganoxidans]MDR6307953.1 small-conductance mechanosensitive channel [Pacificitalea manganoxidans]
MHRLCRLLLGLALLTLPILTPNPGALLSGAQPLAGAAWAQTEAEAIDYDEWERLATRAEEVLATGQASTEALEIMRGTLANWRTRFLQGQSINATQIQTLRDQISALGAAPDTEAGESEPEEIAARRAALEERLAELQVPIRTAEEAYSRASGLIRQLDALVRERQAAELTELGPTPLNPAHYATAWEDAQTLLRGIAAEFAAAWSMETRSELLRRNGPVVVILGLIGLVLALRGRVWSARIADRVLRRSSAAARAVVLTTLVSLGQLVLPLVGLVLMVLAVLSTGMTGPIGETVLRIIPVMGLTFFVARWLGALTFPRDPEMPAPLTLSAEQRTEGRLHSTVLGLLLAAETLLQALGDADMLSTAALAVLDFPILVIAGLFMMRLGHLLVLHSRNAPVTDEGRQLRDQVVMVLGRLTILLGVLGPVLAAIGYRAAANFAIFSPVLTLALLAALILLQRVQSRVYDITTKREGASSEGLIPVLVNLLIAVLALPVLALIWGARVSDLTELWSQFLAGFSIGTTRISPGDFMTFAIVFAIGYVITRMLQGTLRNTVLPKTRIDIGGQNALISVLGYIGFFLAAVIAITTAGIDLSSLAIVAGALSVGIGFGLQTIVSNFVSGIILLVERPVSEGDWVQVGGVMGIVKRISVRSTRIETFDRTDVIVPNADLITGQVTNWTKGNMSGRLIVKVGVAYGTDTKLVDRVLREVAEAQPMVILTPPPQVIFMGFGADSLDFEVRAILRDVSFIMVVQNDINHEIARRFAEERIEIPFAQRDLWLRNPDALANALHRRGPLRAGSASAAPGTDTTPDSSATPQLTPTADDMSGDD